MRARVLHLINNLESGGAEQLLADLLPRLARAGVECELVVFQPRRTPLYKVVEESGIPVHDGSGSGLWSPRNISVAAGLLRRNRYEAVHSHLFPAMAWTALACRASGYRKLLVTTEHNTNNRRRRRWIRPIDRAVYGSYDRVVCVSEETRGALVGWHPSLCGKAVVVENGVDLSRFWGLERGKALDRLVGGSGAMIFSVGRLTRQKGFDVLIRSIARLPEARLAIAGEGEARPELEELIRSRRLEGRVRLLGARRDVPELMASADIYVQPSRWEGFGIAAVEAMASSLPLVVSEVSGLSQVVGKAALKAPAEDEAALAEAIAMLLHSAGLRAELGAEGRERSKRYSIDRTVRAHVDLYTGGRN